MSMLKIVLGSTVWLGLAATQVGAVTITPNTNGVYDFGSIEVGKSSDPIEFFFDPETDESIFEDTIRFFPTLLGKFSFYPADPSDGFERCDNPSGCSFKLVFTPTQAGLATAYLSYSYVLPPLCLNDPDGCSPDLIEEPIVMEAEIMLTGTGVSAVPLPAALPLLASGLGALGVIGWRRKRASTTA